MEYKSKNPDLLLEEVMDERIPRVTELCSCYKGKMTPHTLDRVTALVTNRCNFLCKYCTGPHMNLSKMKKRKLKMLSKDLSFNQFKIMLDDWAKHDLRHIHFTGGEATLNKDLIKMVKLTKKKRIFSSITTNGSADMKVYRKLIKAGLTEIRVSIDSHNKEDFDDFVGRKGAFEKVVKNIEEIVKMRDKDKKDIFLVLNVCIGSKNIKQIKQSLKFFISLNPNDIKFLVIVQERKSVLKNRSEKLKKELQGILNSFPEEQFVLLRNKIDNLFNPYAVGLKDKKTQKVMKHCYIPLTERTTDPLNYYPCSIYTRWYGKPLGEISDSFETQQEKILNFVKYHDCRKDKICSNYCTNCCKVFNIAVNENKANVKKIILNKLISKEQIKEVSKKIRNLLKVKIKSTEQFIIIKPFGKKNKKEIMKFIRNETGVKKIVKINNWRDIALFLYCYPLSEKKIQFSLNLDDAFKKIEGNEAEIWFFNKKIPEKKIQKMKVELRGKFKGKQYILQTKDWKKIIALNQFHIPDYNDLRRENKILGNFYSENAQNKKEKG